MVRAHGWDRNLNTKSQKNLREKYKINEFYSKYTFYDLGFNLRPTDINGFIGNIQIKYWDQIVQNRFDNFKFLSEKIESNSDLVSIKCDHMDIVSSFAIPVIVKDTSKIDKYKEIFLKENVEIRPMIAGNMGHQPFYTKYIGNSGVQPNAEFLHSNSFYFGNNPELTESELDLLGSLLAGRKIC